MESYSYKNLISLMDTCYKSFYVGDDKKAWKTIVEIIDEVQNAISLGISGVNRELLFEFIGNIENMHLLKEENNFTLIGDYIYEVYIKLQNLSNN